MSLLEIGKTGASKQSWRSPGPRALLKTLMDEAKDPHDGKVLFSEFVRAVLPLGVRNGFENEDDERRLVAIIEYWFTNNHNSMVQLYPPRPGAEKERTAKRNAQIAKQDKIRKAVREEVQDRAQMLLLDWTMPNGKAMGDCTGEEVREFGRKVAPWLSKIAAKVKPAEIVRNVLSEDDVRKMWGK